MTVQVPVTKNDSHGLRARTYALWSWLMLPVAFVVWVGTSIVELYVVFPILGLNEGDLLLMARNAAGWAWQLLFFAVVLVAPVAGIWLGAMAAKAKARWVAWLAIAANSLVVLALAYNLFDIIRMTYWPNW